jgi:hypothetical protein
MSPEEPNEKKEELSAETRMQRAIELAQETLHVLYGIRERLDELEKEVIVLRLKLSK